MNDPIYLPIGLSDYRKLVTYKDAAGIGYLYADKTEFIAALLADPTEVKVFTRPRRFGKTLNLSMLQYFFAAEVSGIATTELFDGSMIAKDQACMQHQGKHPVILLNFKDAHYNTFDLCYKHLAGKIADLYSDFKKLVFAGSISDEDKEYFQSILNKSADITDFDKSIFRLTKILYEITGQQCIVLIDEYDAPIQDAYLKGYYDELISFMRNLFGSGLKGNAFIKTAILTGIMRVSKESLFSSLNNVEIYSILNEQYSNYFGFTESEVNALLTKAKLPINLAQTKDWYNGYNFGGTTIYNPWSIIKFIKEKGTLGPYWINTSGNDLIREILTTTDAETQEKIAQLIAGIVVQEIVDEHIVFKDLKQNRAAIWSLFLMSGYLKVLSSSKTDYGDLCELAIPNKEVAFLYRKIFREWVSGSHGIIWYQQLLATLVAGNIAEFGRKLQDIILHMASYHDTAKNIQEIFYQGLMLGLLVGLTENYEIRSNRESGLGRYDLIIIPKDKTKIGFVMEFKAINNEDKENLATAAQGALAEIKTLAYTTELKARGITKIYQVGIAFSGKKVLLVSEMM